jgi:DNA repair exonuclease SbcCD nuclease subunit
LIVGDIHIRGDNPRNRIGNYFEDCKQKLNEVFEIAEKENATIIQVGDFFNSPSTSISVVSEIVTLLRDNKAYPIYTVAGNHDIFAHNLSTLNRTPLGFMLEQSFLYHVDDLENMDTGIDFIGRDFDFMTDSDYSEYVTPEHPGKLQILVVHGMLMEKSAPFKHSLMEEVAKITAADVIISGHYHLPFKRIYRGKLFINPGALMRMSATEEEMSRVPQVVLIDTDNWENCKEIPLKCAKSGIEVLDRTAIEINEEREENMALFISSIENTGEQKFMNLQEMMEQIASQDNLDTLIIKEALERLSKVREGLSK